MKKGIVTLAFLAASLIVALAWTGINYQAAADVPVDVLAASAAPTAWIGTPEIIGQSIEVDPPEIIASETSYTQTVTYRQIIEYRVQVGIALD